MGQTVSDSYRGCDVYEERGVLDTDYRLDYYVDLDDDTSWVITDFTIPYITYLGGDGNVSIYNGFIVIRDDKIQLLPNADMIEARRIQYTRDSLIDSMECVTDAMGDLGVVTTDLYPTFIERHQCTRRDWNNCRLLIVPVSRKCRLPTLSGHCLALVVNLELLKYSIYDPNATYGPHYMPTRKALDDVYVTALMTKLTPGKSYTFDKRARDWCPNVMSGPQALVPASYKSQKGICIWWLAWFLYNMAIYGSDFTDMTDWRRYKHDLILAEQCATLDYRIRKFATEFLRRKFAEQDSETLHVYMGRRHSDPATRESVRVHVQAKIDVMQMIHEYVSAPDEISQRQFPYPLSRRA